MANPFKKNSDLAKNSSNKTLYQQQTENTVETKKCAQCGAPRKVNTNVGSCDYCGYKFMDIIYNVNREHEQ